VPRSSRVSLSDFRRRAATALAVAPPVLAALYVGPPFSTIVIVLGGAMAAHEFTVMAAGGGQRLLSPAGAASVVTVVAAVAAGAVWQRWDLAALAGLVGAGSASLLAHLGQSGRAPWFGLGTLYVSIPCCFYAWLRGDTDVGRELALWVLGIVWATDIGAYLVGRTFGRSKLAPAISPGKTWEGLIGGTACAVAGALASSVLVEGPGILELAVLGFAVALCAQAGDLLESWFKRYFGFKDSGRIMPGHGGILDRVDGLFAAATIFGLFVWTATGEGAAWP
jgi:phosphatidate cytidylyltransferase